MFYKVICLTQSLISILQRQLTAKIQFKRRGLFTLFIKKNISSISVNVYVILILKQKVILINFKEKLGL